MSDLPPFSGDDVRCPKCGNEGASTEWVPPLFIGSSGVRGECLERQCRRCSYAWGEATAEQNTTGVKG